MIELQHSDILYKVLDSLVLVTKNKTSEKHALVLLKMLKERLQEKYVFFRYIDFKDDAFEIDTIKINSEINMVNSKDIGRGIQHLIDVLHCELGKQAGYNLIREFRDALGKEYHSAIKEMGVDLRLSELQRELYGWAIEEYQIKDEKEINIAFIEKRKE